MRSTIIVTGVNGFVGQHLARNLFEHGHKVIGIGLDTAVHPALRTFVAEYIPCDLTDETAVHQIRDHLAQADAIINLAGLATTNNDASLTDKVLFINTSVHELLHQALADLGSRTRIIAVSTGLVYQIGQTLPLEETSRLQPDIESTNAYVRSKLRVEKCAEDYRNKGLNIILVRPFNHTGPGQGPGFFVPDQIAKIKQAIQQKTHLSLDESFDFWRDFTDVRDVVNAYRLLASVPEEQLSAKVYNIASGVAVFGRDLFRMIASALDFTEFDLTVSRESSSPNIYGSHDLLTKDTAWQPTFSLKDTIQDQI